MFLNTDYIMKLKGHKTQKATLTVLYWFCGYYLLLNVEKHRIHSEFDAVFCKKRNAILS